MRRRANDDDGRESRCVRPVDIIHIMITCKPMTRITDMVMNTCRGSGTREGLDVSESRICLGCSGAVVTVHNHVGTICTAHRRLWFDRYRCSSHHSRVTRDVLGNSHHSSVLPVRLCAGVWRKQHHVTCVGDNQCE